MKDRIRANKRVKTEKESLFLSKFISKQLEEIEELLSYIDFSPL